MSNRKDRLSAVVIARNEAGRIGRCLDALSWADERIVIDNASDDDTAKIARSAGARVYSAETDDFAELRNLGLAKAGGSWVLYVDADETVTPELAKEISDAVSRGGHAAYRVRRINTYLGSPWPFAESIIRLFHKDALSGWYGSLHESPRLTGTVGQLTAPLAHDTHRTLEEMVAKTNRWSETEASLRLDAGHPPVTWWRLFRVMLTGFWDSYIRQGGWRAGTVGLIESMYQAFSMFITYAKLWEKQQPADDRRPSVTGK